MNTFGKFALILFLMSGISCTMREPGRRTAFKVESFCGTAVPKMELLEADLLLGEKRAVVARWKDGQDRRAWRTYSATTNPRRILATPVDAGKESRVEFRLSSEECLEVQKRLSGEVARLSAVVPKVYRSDFSEEQRKAFWTRHAVEEWLNALKRESKQFRPIKPMGCK